MLAFYYDNSFEGLLSALFDAYTGRAFPDMLLEAGALPPLTASTMHNVVTSAEKSERVFAGLCKRLSPKGRNDLLHVWLSEERGSAELLLRYLRKVFDGPEARGLVEKDLADKDVLTVAQLARKVCGEAHLMQGFARFQKTAEGIYFAALGPKYNVLPLLLSHFAERFAGERWILYDLKRRYGMLHEAGSFSAISLEHQTAWDGRLAENLLADNEKMFQEFWKSYCSCISIKERKNPALQARFMPRRYWPYMTEKQKIAQA